MGGFISFDPAGIQAAIDGKAAKVGSYRRRCDEIWLLVVADDWHQSSSLDLDDETLEQAAAYSFASAFDRVLLYGPASGRVLRLTTTPS